MPLYKNQSGQWLDVFAWDTINNTWKTGDAGNITCAYKIDAGEIGSLADTNPAELDATDMPGAYRFDLAQGEINGDLALYYPKSSTPGILLEPVSVYTTLPGLTTEQKADVNAEADQALADYQGATQSNLTDAVSAIRGADGDTLKTLSDQLDTAQTDLDNPDQYKNDISGLATAAGLAAAVSPLATTAALNTHDGKLDQVKAKTDLIPAVPASQGDVSAVGVLVDTVDTVVDAIKLKTDGLNFTGTDVKATLDSETVTVGDKTGFALTSAYDAAMDAASQESVNTAIDHLGEIKGTGFLENTDSLVNIAHAGADGDTLKTLSDQLDTAQTDLDNPDQYKNDISGLATAAGLAAAHDGKLDQVKAKTDLIPAVPASQGDVSAVGVLVDTVDTVVDAIKTVTDKLDSTLEQDGDVYRLTSNALEQAPGGAGGGDATAANQTVIIGLINDVSAQIDDIGGQAGPGAIRWLYLLTEEGTNIPIADADIWVSTDEAQTNIIASGRTNQNGIVYFDLDEGTVYVWRQKSGWDFVNPQTKMVTP